MNFTLGFSPCPNDTFIFDALVNGEIDTEGHHFEVFLEDVQTLNEWAAAGKLDISKISYGGLPKVLTQYAVMHSGSALGTGVGPLLITKNPDNLTRDINELSIAIPGSDTTAHLLFSLAYPEATLKKFRVFHEIEDAILRDETDAGVIIHENRFTYQDKGLLKIRDLGEYWESTTQSPIPLGGIVIKRSFDVSIQQTIDRLIRKSLDHAFARYPELTDYIRSHAKEMSEDVMRKHIDLYVNHYSLDLGITGRKAVETLVATYTSMHQLPPLTTTDLFTV